jgi:hypothetical protein
VRKIYSSLPSNVFIWPSSSPTLWPSRPSQPLLSPQLWSHGLPPPSSPASSILVCTAITAFAAYITNLASFNSIAAVVACKTDSALPLRHQQERLSNKAGTSAKTLSSPNVLSLLVLPFQLISFLLCFPNL